MILHLKYPQLIALAPLIKFEIRQRFQMFKRTRGALIRGATPNENENEIRCAKIRFHRRELRTFTVPLHIRTPNYFHDTKYTYKSIRYVLLIRGAIRGIIGGETRGIRGEWHISRDRT